MKEMGQTDHVMSYEERQENQNIRRASNKQDEI